MGMTLMQLSVLVGLILIGCCGLLMGGPTHEASADAQAPAKSPPSPDVGDRQAAQVAESAPASTVDAGLADGAEELTRLSELNRAKNESESALHPLDAEPKLPKRWIAGSVPAPQVNPAASAEASKQDPVTANA